MYLDFTKALIARDGNGAPLPDKAGASDTRQGLRLGEILVDARKLSRRNLKRALRLQGRKPMRLGEALVKLKLISRDELHFALASQFAYPCLADKTQSGISNELVTAYQPFSKEAEAVRSLRSDLILRWFSDERRVLAMVSPDSKEGRSYVTANLAVAFSQLGKKTLLIDGDLRTPRQDTIFGLPMSEGLSGALAGPRNGGDIAQMSCLGTLSIAAAGAVPPNPLELLSGAEFGQWLTAMANRFDVVLVDTPAAAAYSDAVVIGARSGGALMLTRKDHTSSNRAREVAERLSTTGTQFVGAVVNRF